MSVTPGTVGNGGGLFSREAVGEALLAFGRELEEQGAAQVGGSFTGSPEADALLEEDPNAFLLGVLFTQGIPAERAWAGPYLLKQRLGHLDVHRLASEPESVLEAVQLPPMLHRFKNGVPAWVSSAAERLVDEYGCDASRIWAEGSHVVEVMERLLEFDGIGRKKAAMATGILSRHFGVMLDGLEFGQVAYDVHVRRVFLRSGLVEVDSAEAIEQVARAIAPDSPVTLDLAAWLIGRQMCRPKVPMCDACRLGEVCPRQTWISVEGVGTRRAGR